MRRDGAPGDHHCHRLADMHRPLGGKRRPVRQDQRFAAAPGERRMTAEAADTVHILRREYAQHAARAQRDRYIHADDARESVRRAHEMRISLTRQWSVGGITAAATDQNIVFDARLTGRAAICFCIHALFRNYCRYTGCPLITETVDC